MNPFNFKHLQADDDDLKKIQTIYQNYPEFPYISPDRDLKTWLKEADLSSASKVPHHNMIRTAEGLLPGHIILLWRISHGSYTTDQWVTKYFEYDYGIDAVSDINGLVAEGYVRLMTAKESLFNTKGPFLTQLLKEKGISGYSKLTKAELVEQVKDHFSEAELKEKLTTFVYALTDKGQTALKNNQAVVAKHPQKKMYQ